MADLTLYIGNRNYSSWSLRGHLALAHAGVPFDEVMIPLDLPGSSAAIRAHSPSSRVPALRHRDLTIWDSLAIGEYLAETFPDAKLWPDDRAARAVARSVSAEMHSSFAALRQHMPMNVRARWPGVGRTQASLADVDRVLAIWRDCRARFGSGGPFLFGRFSVADAMFAPVVTRFVTYAVTLDDVASAYVGAIQALPALKEWARAAETEKETIPEEDYPTFRY
jgi:glutathione S-transferase